MTAINPHVACKAVCAPRAASGCPMNPGGEWCPTDQKLIDKCPEC